MKNTEKPAFLLTKYLLRRSKSRGKKETEILLSQNTDLNKAFRIVAGIKVRMDQKSLETAEEATWTKISAGMHTQTELEKQSRFYRLRYYVAAASIILLLTGTFITLKVWKEPAIMIVMNTAKEGKQITLPDSSKVWLFYGAKIKYPEHFDSRQREVTLEGEAFFDVVKEKGRQFRVMTDVIQITVLGTRFDVKTDDKNRNAQVVLESGSVRLSGQNSPDASVILKPGEMGTLIEGEKQIQIDEVDVRLYTSWKDEYLNIKSQSLENVAFMLSKRYHADIRIEGDTLKNEVFSGRFCKDQSLEEVFEIIDMMIPVHYELRAGVYWLVPK